MTFTKIYGINPEDPSDIMVLTAQPAEPSVGCETCGARNVPGWVDDLDLVFTCEPCTDNCLHGGYPTAIWAE